MAGRGRGRGFRMSFNLESVGVGRGESLQQPTPIYPVMEQKPLPLSGGEQVEYLLALKQEFRGAMRSLPCFLQPRSERRDVERYSDKYHSNDQQELDWTPDWTRFPRELRVRSQKPCPSGPKPVSVSRRSDAQKKQTLTQKGKDEVLLKLETLEQKETHSDEEEEEKKPEEEEAEEEEYDEEEFEEETDYIMSYFDNGEDCEANSDDNMDEAIY